MTTAERARARIPTYRWLPLVVLGGLPALFAAAAVVAYYL